MKILLFSLFIVIVLFSCNCHYEGSGYVVDEVTRQPIAHAQIEVYSGVPGKDTLSPPVYTDSNGFFEYSHDHCKDLIQIYKEGYYGFVRSAPKGDTITLEIYKTQL